MFLLKRPARRQIEAVLQKQRVAAFSYRAVGATRGERFPPGFHLDRNSVRLGSGSDALQAAKSGLREWAMMDLGWLKAFPAAETIQPGMDVAVVVSHLGFWSVNVSRIVYVAETQSSYSFAYGTLAEHAESGEERFTVAQRDDGAVWYEIVAFSRPRHPMARIGYPFARTLQRRFARDSMARMKAAAAGW